MRGKKIVLVTSSQPSLNPRMVKEADTLAEAGYEVVVIGQFWNSWATATDKILLSKKKWRFIRVGGSPSDEWLSYQISRLIHKIARKIRAKGILSYKIAELSVGRCTYQLYKEAVKQQADLYIGHNPGGLPPAILAAKRWNVKCGFDAEDFHRLEYSDNLSHPDVQCKSYLEHKYFPQADYITTSSPQISEEYKKIFPHLTFTTVLNVFPKVNDVQVKQSHDNDPLKLFWFSQTIGPNRGLDEAIEAVRLVGSPLIEIHALGSPRQQAILNYKALAKKYSFSEGQLSFYAPIPPDDIYEFASNFDIGLATEIGEPFNRTICLTNKIFTYIQAGLALAASRTPAQEELIEDFSICGRLFGLKNAKELADILHHYLIHRDELNSAKLNNFKYGQEHLNWETESKKFINLVKSTLDEK